MYHQKRERSEYQHGEGGRSGARRDFTQRRQQYSPAGVDSCELFVGLGPNGRNVAEADLRNVLQPFGEVTSIAFTPQGTGVVVRLATEAGAAAAAKGLRNTYIGDVRLSVRGNDSGPRNGGAGARGSNGYIGQQQGTPCPTRLYVGLGPNGQEVAEADLRHALESVAPITGLRHIGRCAFVDVDSAQTGETLIAAMNGTTVGRSRLVVRCCYE